MRDQYGERLLKLERQLYDLQTELNGTRQRMVSQAGAPPTRVAKIAAAAATTDQKVFSLIFQDGTFPDVIGPGDATWVDRQNAAKHVGFNLGNKQPGEGDRVVCWRIGGRWWFAVNEGGGTTTVEGAATNVFSRPKSRYVTGSNTGDQSNLSGDGTSTATTIVLETLNDRGLLELEWQQKLGPDIGVTVVAGGGYNLKFANAGTYLLTINAQVRRLRAWTGAPENPDFDEIGLRVEMATTNSNGTVTVDTRVHECTMRAWMDYTDAVPITDAIRGTGDQWYETIKAFNFTGTVAFGFSVPNATVRTRFIISPIHNDTEASNWGLRVYTPLLTVTRVI